MLLPKSPLSSHRFWNCLNNEAPREFVLFYPFLRGDGRFPRQAWWAVPTGGYPGGGSLRAAAQESSLWLLDWSGLHGAFQNVYIYWSLDLSFKKNFFFLAKADNGSLSCKEFSISQKWWKASTRDFLPHPRSCSKQTCTGSRKEVCQSERPAYYFKALLPLGFCPSGRPSPTPTGRRARRPGFKSQLL